MEDDNKPFIPNIHERAIGMALALYENRTVTVDDLIKAAKQIAAFIEERGS